MLSDKIIHNKIKCRHCGLIMESEFRHDFVAHQCTKAGLISRRYDNDAGEYVPAYPYIAVDGGKDYVRVVGHYDDYEMLTEYEGTTHV